MPIPVDRAGNTTGIIGSPSPGMEEGRRHRRPTRDLRHHPGRVSAGWRRGLPHTARTTSPHTEPRPTRTARTVPASSPDSVAGARRPSGHRRTDNQPVHATRPAERNLPDSPVGRTPAAARPRPESRNRPAGAPAAGRPAPGTTDQEQRRRAARSPGPEEPPRRCSPEARFPQMPLDSAGFPRIKWWAAG